MDKKEAESILDEMGCDTRKGALSCWVPVVFWNRLCPEIALDGTFTLEQLKAIVWWIENKEW
jgi:hypothetical protein